ncbi:MAG: hypothetical protein KME19_24740 [Microcoleus vaginatus WJT46-NPBG5]|jgi:hypothetical protein|nr:hypothetical protein [Microcoleus vaginatus WJT46-NPBG5]
MKRYFYEEDAVEGHCEESLTFIIMSRHPEILRQSIYNQRFMRCRQFSDLPSSGYKGRAGINDRQSVYLNSLINKDYHQDVAKCKEN